jgi:hypothetical protein
MLILLCCILPVCILVLFPLAWLEEGGSWKCLAPVTLCAFLMAYGIFAFFAQAGGLWFLGESSEWPLLGTEDAVENARGERFVPLVASARIQVYDREGKFVRGWSVPTAGGVFKLHVTKDDNLDVFAARGDRHLVFAADGTLLTDDHYREGYDRLPSGPNCRVNHATAWYLWPLTNPGLAMLPGVAGLVGLALLFNNDRLHHARFRGPETLGGRVAFRVVVPWRANRLPSFSCRGTAFVAVGDTAQELPSAEIDFDHLKDRPWGTWFEQDARGFSVGASTRSAAALVLVPFMAVWSYGLLGGLYVSQIVEREFHPILSLVGLPFVAVAGYFWMLALMWVFGKVAVTVEDNVGTVFVGIGSLGWRRSFDWHSVDFIRKEASRWGRGYRTRIALDGPGLHLKFGTDLNEKRKDYMLRTLKCMKKMRERMKRMSG